MHRDSTSSAFSVRANYAGGRTLSGESQVQTKPMTGKQQNAEARKVFVQTLARDLGITQGLSQRKFQEKVLMGFSKALFVRLVHVGVLKLDQREQFTLAALKVSNALECVPIANKSQFDADCGWKQKQAKSAVFDEILSIFQDPEQPSVDETTETSE